MTSAANGLRILHVLDHSVPLHSGYTFRTLAILREQHRLGWTTFQLTTPKQGATRAGSETVDGLVLHRTPNSGKAGLVWQMVLTARRIAELARELRPDLIHAHSPVLNALPALWSRAWARVPLVYEMRASWEDAAVDHGTTVEGSARYRASRELESFALRRADAITTICEGLRQDIAVRGIAPGKVTVIPNAVDVHEFPYGAPPDEALRARLGLNDCTVLGFLGSFYGYEGLKVLVDALAILAPAFPRLRVMLVGGGPVEQELKAQVQALGLDARVLFVGRVPHAEVHRYYGLVDLLVYPRLPTRLTDLVTPLKPLEAMAQGHIVLASDVGGHRELIRDGETGYLFPAGSPEALANQVRRSLDDSANWPHMRRTARAFVERERTWARSVAGYVGAYGLAFANRGVPVPRALRDAARTPNPIQPE